MMVQSRSWCGCHWWTVRWNWRLCEKKKGERQSNKAIESNCLLIYWRLWYPNQNLGSSSGLLLRKHRARQRSCLLSFPKGKRAHCETKCWLVVSCREPCSNIWDHPLLWQCMFQRRRLRRQINTAVELANRMETRDQMLKQWRSYLLN